MRLKSGFAAVLAGCFLAGGLLLGGCSMGQANVAGKVTELLEGNSVPVYSEAEKTVVLDKYFEAVALADRQYCIAEEGGKTYLLMRYNFYGYGSTITAINKARKQYDGDGLTIYLDVKMNEKNSAGCFPNISSFDCCFELEREVNKVAVALEEKGWETEYQPYSGGIFVRDGMYGVMDADLNEIVPAEYESIHKWGYSPSGTTFYYTRKEDANGLMDENFRQVLSNSYSNIVIVSENRFIAMKEQKSSDSGSIPGGSNNREIVALDAEENILGESIYGFLDAYQIADNYAQQMVFGHFEGDHYFEGVIDADLNIIIEPVYKNVVMFDKTSENQFYVVQNSEDEYAVFDYRGIQRTEYAKTSVYDVQTSYRK